MTSATEMVREARTTYLMTGQREARARLDTAMLSNDLTMTVADAMIPLASNQYLEVEWELMTAWSVAGAVVTVERGEEGTTPVAHAQGKVVTINPIFPQSRILAAAQAELASLSSDPTLWKPTVIEFPYNRSDYTYDLGATEISGIAAVDISDGTGNWTPLNLWTLKRGLTGQEGITADCGINIRGGADGRTVRVVAKTPLGSIDSDTTDVETDTGLPSASLLAVGAALRLAAGREIKRTFIEGQGDSRRANEVAPYQTMSSTRNLEALYKRLRGEAQSAINQRYPAKRKRQ